MSAALKLPSHHMTVVEFLEWAGADQSSTRWQLCDGEPQMMAPASERHGTLQARLIYLLSAHLERSDGHCRVVVAPGVIPRIQASQNFRIPDVGITCAPLTRDVAMPDAVVLFEILSPSNEGETRTNVWAYTSIPSVAEIVVLRSDRIEAEVLRRQTDQSWPPQPDLRGPDDTLHLHSIGFAAPLLEIYRSMDF